MGFSRQKYWNRLPCPPLGDPPNPGIEPTSLRFSALAGGFFITSATWEAPKEGWGGGEAFCPFKLELCPLPDILFSLPLEIEH